jgi:hypothetical protein
LDATLPPLNINVLEYDAVYIFKVNEVEGGCGPMNRSHSGRTYEATSAFQLTVPEGGDCNIYRNVTTASTCDMAKL